MPAKKKRKKDKRLTLWPHAKPRSGRYRQDPDNPQPMKPRGSSQRGGKQSAEELRHPPTRPGNNGGTLRTGGTNKGGNGATPSALRSRCRTTLAVDKIFSLPRKIILSKRSSDKDKLNAWGKLAQYGCLAALSITDADGNPVELPAFIVEMVARGETQEKTK